MKKSANTPGHSHAFSRRSFLGGAIAGLGGLMLARSLSERGAARAAPGDIPYGGPLLLGIHAGGGWDPIFLCDPKPDAKLNRVSQSVGEVGPFRFSDHAVDPIAFGYDANYTAAYGERLLSNRTFFERHGTRLTVFNGVDTRTNNHDTGTRYVWSGKSEVGHPALGAIVAAMGGGKPPLAFLSSGGYDDPGGLVPLSRASSSGSMRKLMFPNAIDANKPEDPGYHSAGALDAIRRAQAGRISTQAASLTLPTARRALAELVSARGSMGELAALEIPTLIDIPGNNLEDVQGVLQSTQLAIAAMKGGLSLAASLSYGGFDTHGNHDRDQVVRISKLLGIVDFAIAEAARQGVADRLVIVVGSDFGRGPFYNGTNGDSGKDHWANTSMLVHVPPGKAAAFGNRVIGSTTDDVRSNKLTPGAYAPDAAGLSLTPGVVHAGLRKLLAVDGSDGAVKFPVPASEMAVFG